MNKDTAIFHYIKKSKFVRSIFLQVLSIFLIVSIEIVAIVFYSFASEINRNIISDRQKQLAVIEDTISKRMEEVTSIAYSVAKDPAFYLEPVAGEKYSGYEMSNTLAKYLVGNGFIEYLAYYRLSEPDKIYTSTGELTFHNFWKVYLNFANYTEEEYLNLIKSTTAVGLVPLATSSTHSYFTYVCPLPQFSANPQAFVLMLIPLAEVSPLLDSQLANSYGEIAVFGTSGKELYRMGSLEAEIDLSKYKDAADQENVSIDGDKYVVQRQVSDSNGWTYVSIIRLDDIISGLANKQLLFIILLLMLMFVAIFAMLICIIIQYKPISNLAVEVTEETEGGSKPEIVDERVLLSSTFAALKGDSEQKQKFETAYREAEAANKAKSAFLSSMSHDIRTPMNAIIGMTAIALKHPEDPDYVQECLQKVQVASQYLLDIINNVLDMSRIESGRFTLSEEAIDLPKLIYGLMTVLNQSVEDKQQHLLVEVENIQNEKLLGDSVRLMQVFMNILSNSVKFTPPEGTINLHICQEESEKAGWGRYVFTFSDTGMGMSAEFVEQVFDTFSRAKEAGVSRIEGTGLGMAIAKNLVELMGGTIRCASELGKGTKFTVAIPLKLAETEVEAELEDKERSVLIWGQEEKICLNQVQLFKKLGIRAVYTLALAQAKAMVRQAFLANKPYKLVIINQTKEDQSGIKALNKISAGSETADTAYILAAQELAVIKQSAAKESGIDAFVQIPLFPSTARNLFNKTFEVQGVLVSKENLIDLEGKRILVVEDNAINREIAHKIIGETKAEIVEAANGQEAVQAFQEHPPGYFAVILMDLQMPVMDGYEATAIIRSLPREDALSIPIYALTASTFDEDVRQVKEAGMNGHIGKPYSPDTLYQALRQAIS